MAALLVLVGALTSCGTGVDVSAAPDGRSSECTALIAARPTTVLGQPSRPTTGEPGTAAWGDPAIVLRCGTEPLGPTTLECLDVDGVDWVVLGRDDSGAIFVSYGRTPAVEVEVPAAYDPEAFALADLAPALRRLPRDRACR